MLALPDGAAPPDVTPEKRQEEPSKNPPKSAEVLEQRTYEDGVVSQRIKLEPQVHRPPSDIDSRLDQTGLRLLIAGLLTGVICLGVAFYYFTSYQSGTTTETEWRSAIIWVVAAIAAGVQGFVAQLLFNAAAEVIRLLRQANQTVWTGKTVEVAVRRRYSCSGCNAAAKPGQERCSRCGAQFKPGIKVVDTD